MSNLHGRVIKARFAFNYDGTVGEGFRLDVDLELPGWGTTAIVGQSGSGKTTLLRCIAGLQPVRHGELTVNGDVWQSHSGTLPTHKRPLGYVFQEASLFAHFTADENLVYAIKRSRSREMQERYHRVVALLSIEPILQQYPSQLSGGERQRVAIARALLVNPSLLLMDEPLASLDDQRKQEILPYLKKLRQEFELPILYVSHSLAEVARFADHLVVLEHGKVAALGPIADVLSRVDIPVCLGDEAGVVLKARVVERDARWHLTRVAFDGGQLWLPEGGDGMGDEIRIRILARDVSLARSSHQDSSILNRLAAEVIEIAPDRDQAMALVRLKMGTAVAVARVTRRSTELLQLNVGDHLWAQIKSVAVIR